tara:strand:- start:23837 stop:25069 length:1233 start_codon:yes stop_codon:yes gene_type:complete
MENKNYKSFRGYGTKDIINKNVYELAIERLNIAFDKLDQLVVMFSGGKDSTACLNLTLEVIRQRKEKNLEVHFIDEEAIPYETINYVRRIKNIPEVDLNWWCLPIKHRNGCSSKKPFWYPWAPEDKEKWVRDIPEEAITEIEGYENNKPEKRLMIPDMNGYFFNPKKYGNVGIVMGIRADESLVRTRAILNSRTREDTHILKNSDGTSFGNTYKIYPIYDWSTEDVWTAPKKFNWDYNTTYDVYDKMGVSPNAQRCAPPFGEEPMRGLYQFKEGFPDIWEKMQYRVEGAATAARYARSKLYAFGNLPDKPKEMKWEDFLKYYIKQHKKENQKEIAKRVDLFIRQHKNKTDEPLMIKSPHPISGISWNFLLKIAMRGDSKQRKTPPFSGVKEVQIKQRRKYNEERFGVSTN